MRRKLRESREVVPAVRGDGLVFDFRVGERDVAGDLLEARATCEPIFRGIHVGAIGPEGRRLLIVLGRIAAGALAHELQEALRDAERFSVFRGNSWRPHVKHTFSVARLPDEAQAVAASPAVVSARFNPQRGGVILRAESPGADGFLWLTHVEAESFARDLAGAIADLDRLAPA